MPHLNIKEITTGLVSQAYAVCVACVPPPQWREHTHTHTHTPSLHPSTASEIHQQTHSSPSPSRPLLQTTGSAQHRDTLQGSWGWGCIMPPLTARRHLYLVYVCGPGHPILGPQTGPAMFTKKGGLYLSIYFTRQGQVCQPPQPEPGGTAKH